MTSDAAQWAREQARRLMAEYPEGITLDAVGEVVGAQVVTVLHIEALFDELEVLGVPVEQGLRADVSGLLGQVLVAARRLRARGESVGPELVAAESGLSEREVRVALLFAHVLAR